MRAINSKATWAAISLASVGFGPTVGTAQGQETEQKNSYDAALRKLDELNQQSEEAFAREEGARRHILAPKRGSEAAGESNMPIASPSFPLFRQTGHQFQHLAPIAPQWRLPRQPDTFDLFAIAGQQSLRSADFVAQQESFALVQQLNTTLRARQRRDQLQQALQGRPELDKKVATKDIADKRGSALSQKPHRSNSPESPSGTGTASQPVPGNDKPESLRHSDPLLGELEALGINTEGKKEVDLAAAQPVPAELLRSGGESINGSLTDGALYGPFLPSQRTAPDAPPVVSSWGVWSSGLVQFSHAQKLANDTGRPVYLAYNESAIEGASKAGAALGRELYFSSPFAGGGTSGGQQVAEQIGGAVGGFFGAGVDLARAGWDLGLPSVEPAADTLKDVGFEAGQGKGVSPVFFGHSQGALNLSNGLSAAARELGAEQLVPYRVVVAGSPTNATALPSGSTVTFLDNAGDPVRLVPSSPPTTPVLDWLRRFPALTFEEHVYDPSYREQVRRALTPASVPKR